MDILLETLYVFNKPISITLSVLMSIGGVGFILGKFTAERDKQNSGLILLIFSAALLSVTIYSKLYIEKRPVFGLADLNAKYKGKKVRVDNEIREISSIEFNDVREVQIKYKSNKLTENSDNLLGTEILLLVMLLGLAIIVFEIVYKKYARSGNPHNLM